MDAFEPSEEEQHALPSSNQQDYANRLGEHQNIKLADRKHNVVQAHHSKLYDSLHTTRDGHPPKQTINSKELPFVSVQDTKHSCYNEYRTHSVLSSAQDSRWL